MADTNSSHDFLVAEAKRIIAIAIENAIKHLSTELAEEDCDKIAVADYWPFGNDVNEQTGGLAIEAFVKVIAHILMTIEVIGLFVGVGEG